MKPRVVQMKVGGSEGRPEGSRCVIEFDTAGESAMEIYEAFERMLAAWPDARVPLKVGLPLAAKGTLCGCGTDHGGWTCSHCTKRKEQMKPGIGRTVETRAAEGVMRPGELRAFLHDLGDAPDDTRIEGRVMATGGVRSLRAVVRSEGAATG